jgi:hypothetical protein
MMTRRPDLLLHIGQSKTGTSSIQRSLGARREALLAQGILYPRSPGAANHGLLPASLVPMERLGAFHPHVWEGLPPERRLARFRREFGEEMGAMGPDVRRVIISAEQCSGLMIRPEEVARLRDALAPYFATVRVVLYLRRQDQHFASGYTQALRIAVIRPPALPSQGPEHMPSYDYAALLDRWASVFGADAMTPRIFERETMLNGDVVDDFLALAGIDLVVPPDDPNRRSNLSVASGGLAVMLAMGQHLRQHAPDALSPASPLWRRFVQAVSDALPGGGWRPAPEEANAFLERFRTSNEAVRARWFPDRAQLFSEVAGIGSAGAADASALTVRAALDAACKLLAREFAAAQAQEAGHAVRMARLQERLGDAASARRSYAAALRAVPDHAEAHYGLGMLDLAERDVAAAEGHLEALRRHAPDQSWAERLQRQLSRATAPAADPARGTV